MKAISHRITIRFKIFTLLLFLYASNLLGENIKYSYFTKNGFILVNSSLSFDKKIFFYAQPVKKSKMLKYIIRMKFDNFNATPTPSCIALEANDYYYECNFPILITKNELYGFFTYIDSKRLRGINIAFVVDFLISHAQTTENPIPAIGGENFEISNVSTVQLNNNIVTLEVMHSLPEGFMHEPRISSKTKAMNDYYSIALRKVK